METRKESRSCRICGSVVRPTHCVALFSTKSLNSGLAERLSKVADVPVAPDDGLTKFICGICNRKLLSAESFIRTAKASYEKHKASPSGSGTGDTMGSQAQITRKRTKDTSGPEASPHTSQCRPVAKRPTPERPGRRVTYPDCHNSQTDNCTELLSDSINDKVPGTTDGPGDQELHVIGTPNVSQNSAEVTEEASLIVLEPCDNKTEDAMAAPTSVKISVYSPRNGADVITFDRDKMIIWIQKKAKQHSKISDTQSNNSAGSDNDDEEDSAIVVDD